MAATVTNRAFDLAALKNDPRNAREHGDAQIANIAESIDTFGYVDWIIVQPDGQIIGGHATLQALLRLGRTNEMCIVVEGLTPALYSALGLALNKLPEDSHWNAATLRQVVDSIGDDELLGAAGFDADELESMRDDGDPLEVKRVATSSVDDVFWIAVRGPLQHQAAALNRLEVLMAEFPGVEVELGTINVDTE